MSLQLTVLDLVRQRLGMMETSRNRGPEIDEYHRSVGLQPEGQWPWCCDGMFYMFKLAVAQLGGGMVNPFPKTASSQALWRLAEPICRESNPEPGAVYVLRHSESTGHVGIVETCEDGFVTTELSGNTNGERGGREGNQWARHRGQPEVTHGGILLGFLCFDRAAQPPNVIS